MLPLEGLDTEQVRTRVSSPKSLTLLINLFLDIICFSGTQKSEEHRRMMYPRGLAHKKASTTITFNIILFLCDILALRLLRSRDIDAVIISILCIRTQEFKDFSRCYHYQMVEHKFESSILTAEPHG